MANDSEPAFLLKLGPDGRFTDTAVAAGVAYNEDGAAVAGMGADVADWNNDGSLDLLVTALSGETYSLYRNRGDATFDYVSGPAGVATASFPFSGWGTRLLDLDNDGWKDLLVAQGHVLDTIELTSDQFKYRQPPLLLRGRPAGFERADGGSALRHPWAGRGAAFGDLDNDGDVDVVLGTCNERAIVLRNDGGSRQPLDHPAPRGIALEPRRAGGARAHAHGGRPCPDPCGHDRRQLPVRERPAARRGPGRLATPALARGGVAQRSSTAAGGRRRGTNDHSSRTYPLKLVHLAPYADQVEFPELNSPRGE